MGRRDGHEGAVPQKWAVLAWNPHPRPAPRQRERPELALPVCVAGAGRTEADEIANCKVGCIKEVRRLWCPDLIFWLGLIVLRR